MSENTKTCQEQDAKKHYKLFRVTNSFPNGDLISDYIGDAVGHMESGATVTSNTPRGSGYPLGILKAERSAAFKLTENRILTLPEGDSLLEQADIGSHPLSFIRSFIEFVELKRPVTISGNYFEGFDGERKAYVVDIQMEEGEEPKMYIMTNRIHIHYLGDLNQVFFGGRTVNKNRVPKGLRWLA
jgi:hypothetical protein